MLDTIHNRLNVREFELSDHSRWFIELNLNQVNDLERLADQYRDLYHYVAQNGVRVVYEKVFGDLSAKSRLMDTREAISTHGGLEMAPFTYVEGMPIAEGPISTIFLYGIIPKHNGIDLTYFRDDAGGRTIASRVRTRNAGFLYIFGLDDGHLGSNPVTRFDQLYETLDRQITQYGFEFNDMVRSWIYLRDIQKDYVAFNHARKRIFSKRGINYGPASENLPASTCIEGKVACEADMNIDIICIDKHQNAPAANRLYNPLQNEAEGDTYQFKPTFARGILLEDTDYREIQISGTASIGHHGSTEYQGDPYRQIKKTLINVREMMRPHGFDFSDVCQSTCFFKEAAFFQYFQQAAEDLDIDTRYINTFVIGNVCRDDLLFELDGIAMRKTT